MFRVALSEGGDLLLNFGNTDARVLKSFTGVGWGGSRQVVRQKAAAKPLPICFTTMALSMLSFYRNVYRLAGLLLETGYCSNNRNLFSEPEASEVERSSTDVCREQGSSSTLAWWRSETTVEHSKERMADFELGVKDRWYRG